VQILDDRGELVTTLCGNILFPAGTAYSASLSSFAPSPSGLGGAITIFLNNQVVAAWNGMSSNGHLVPNGFYHFKITENSTDGSIVILARDAFIAAETGSGGLQMSARPNITHPGDTVTILASFSGTPPDSQCKIKIYDMTGELLETLSLSNGTAAWNLRNQQGQELGTGLYLAVFDGKDPVSGNPIHQVAKILFIH
jgi:hypothetical protein